jgi:predicted RNA binding protein YcfA (HicA-like mRNA interferase family)
MGSIPVLKSKEVASILVKLGFEEVRQRGSHKQFRHADGRSTSERYPATLCRSTWIDGKKELPSGLRNSFEYGF